jgi:tetratricopeptide (TPR) repeat protein
MMITKPGLVFCSSLNAFARMSVWITMKSLVKKALIFAMALAVVAAAGWFGRKAYRAATERRLIPKETWAIDQLVRKLYGQGDTLGIQTLLTRAQASDPTDARLKNNLADVFLLRNSEIEKADRLSKEAYDAAPDDPFSASTYAYSLLLQNRRDEAVKVLDRVKPEYLKIPTVAAYYGIIEAECGHIDIAKAPLTRADAATLLPEEKELVRRARARL